MTDGKDAMRRRARWRRGLPIAGLLVILAIGLAVLWFPATAWSRTRARRAWLVGSEAEVRRQLQSGRPAATRVGPDGWYTDQFVLFDQGWAAWRLHSFHWDASEGGDWSGVGDLTVLIDDRGRVLYSRSHFCDGTLGWALGFPIQPLPARPSDLDAFLALFKPGTWTEDRATAEAAIPPGNPSR